VRGEPLDRCEDLEVVTEPLAREISDDLEAALAQFSAIVEDLER